MTTYTVPYNLVNLPSALGGEMLYFDATGAGTAIPAGADGNLLSVVGGVPSFIDPLASGTLSIAAENITYDNSTSGLTATNVQDALDELDSTVDSILGGGSLDFVDLGDTPADYVGQGGLYLRVNAGETGLEFSPSLDINSFSVAPLDAADSFVFFDQSNGNTPSLATLSDLQTFIGGGGGGGGTAGIAVDTATYLFGVDYDGIADDTLPVPTPPAGGENELFIFFDGIFQNNTSWNLINGGNDVQFTAVIPNTISQIEIRQVVPDTATINLNMDDVIVTGPFVGDPYVIPLPVDPGVLENIWIYYNGIQQYPDPLIFSLTAGPNLSIAGGVPAGIDEIYLKIGTTTFAFDIDSLPAAGALAGTDALALSQGGTESQTDLDALTTFLGGALGGTIGGLVGIQSFTSNGVYNATPGTQAVMVICTGGGGRSNTDNPSSPGGTSSFGAFCSATGGNTALTPGTGSGGIINITGGEGLSGGIPSAGESATGGFGGASFWGGGGNAGVPGRNGTAYGSGPGGSTGLTTTGGGSAGGTAIDFITSGFDGTAVTVGAGGFSNAQGSGAPGIVVVFEFG